MNFETDLILYFRYSTDTVIHIFWTNLHWFYIFINVRRVREWFVYGRRIEKSGRTDEKVLFLCSLYPSNQHLEWNVNWKEK